MTDPIAIRKKVAALCGYIDICREVGFCELWKGCKKNGIYVILPSYELSLDAITNAFNERGLTWTLEKRLVEEHDEIVYFALSGKHHGFSNRSNGAAMAMCYLFIELMEANKITILESESY